MIKFFSQGILTAVTDRCTGFMIVTTSCSSSNQRIRKGFFGTNYHTHPLPLPTSMCMALGPGPCPAPPKEGNYEDHLFCFSA